MQFHIFVFPGETCLTSIEKAVRYVQLVPDRNMQIFSGGVAERSNAVDCKSTGHAFDGSNPSPTTIFARFGQKNEAVRLRFIWLSLASLREAQFHAGLPRFIR